MAFYVRELYETLLFGRDNPRKASDSSSVQNFERCDSHSTVDDKPGLRHTEGATGPWGSVSTSRTDLSRSSTLQAIPSAVKRALNREPGHDTSWQPTFLQLRPLIGLCALVVALCCVFGALVVLVVSDGEPVDSWVLAPTVYLAIMTALGNRYAQSLLEASTAR